MNPNYISGLLLLFTLLVTGVDKKIYRIGIMILIMSICDNISIMLGKNLVYFHIYTVIEYLLFSYVLMEFQHEFKGLIKVGLFIGLAGIVYLETSGLSRYDTLPVSLECGIIFLLCLKSIYALAIYKIIPPSNRNEYENYIIQMLKDYRFYFLIGILQYTLFTSVIFLGANSYPELTTILHALFNIIMILCFIISLIVYMKSPITICKKKVKECRKVNLQLSSL